MINSKNPKPKIGVIFLGRRRPGFDMDWGKQMEARVRDALLKAPFEPVEADEKVIDDVSLRRAMTALQSREVEAVILVQATMGDTRLSQTLAQLWPDPLILWATPEKPDGDMISSCSLVGTHCWGSVLRQMHHAFELVYGDPDLPATQLQLANALRLAITVRRLKTVRLAVVGGQAPGYFAMAAEPFVIHRQLGVQTQFFSLVEFTHIAQAIAESAVAADVARFKLLGCPHKDTTDADLPMASRLYLAMKHLFADENFDALTIRDWPEMPETFGQWPYLGVARLADEGLAVGIEGDADGALGAWIVENLGLGRCYLSDWLEHDAQTITLWHGGAAPLSLCEPVGAPGGPRIARHFNIKKPAVIEATLRAHLPVTVFRFWRCDGRYFLTAREGETLPPRRHLMATNALAGMDCDPRAWFEELFHAGMPHHVALVQGRHAAWLQRLAHLLNIQFI